MKPFRVANNTMGYIFNCDRLEYTTVYFMPNSCTPNCLVNVVSTFSDIRRSIPFWSLQCSWCWVVVCIQCLGWIHCAKEIPSRRSSCRAWSASSEQLRDRTCTNHLRNFHPYLPNSMLHQSIMLRGLYLELWYWAFLGHKSLHKSLIQCSNFA